VGEEIKGERTGRKKKDPDPDGPMGDAVPEFIALADFTVSGEFYFESDGHASEVMVLRPSSREARALTG